MTGSMRRLPGPGARSRFNSLRWEIGVGHDYIKGTSIYSDFADSL